MTSTFGRLIIKIDKLIGGLKVFMDKKKSALKLNIPGWIKELSPAPKKYLAHVLKTMAFSKMQEYQRKEEPFREKYQQDFSNFEKKVKKLSKEDFEKWDDYVVWKGIHQAQKKWRKRYQSM